MSGYHRTGGNLRPKRKTRKAAVKSFANGQHFDPRMNLTLADIKRTYPQLCAVPKRVELISESSQWNRQPALPDRDRREPPHASP